MPRVGEDLVAVAVFDDRAPVHHRHRVGQVFDHRQVVGDEKVGQVEVALQIQQQVDDARLDRHVQRRDRFVESEDPGPQGQRAGDTDALLLASGELAGVAAGVGTAQADDLEQLRHPDVGRGFVHTVGAQRFGEDVEDRQPGIQRGDRILEDHLQVTAQLPAPLPGEGGDVTAEHLDGARLRGAKFEDLVQGRRLSRPRLADDAQRAALLYFEADSVDGADFADLAPEHHALGQPEGPGQIPHPHDDVGRTVLLRRRRIGRDAVDLRRSTAGHPVGADAGRCVAG